ncbi:MAG: hypothetical protein WD845_09710 [Pirellulales bacterium]
MDHLHKQVRRARRRLILQSFVGRLIWCWFASLLLAVVAIGAGKIWPLTDAMTWAAGCVGAALAVGTLAAVVWTWLSDHESLEAAVEIDRRFGLKERVSSTLALSPGELDSDAGRALANDAAHRLQNVDVAERFAVRLDRRALLPLAPAALAFVLALGIDGRQPQAPAATKPAVTTQIKKSTDALAKKLEEKRKQAAEAGLEDADALLKELQARAKDLGDKPDADRKKTLVALNELVKDAEKRRQEVAGADELKQQLAQLKNLQAGPAKDFGQALKTGDLSKAMQELDKLKEKLAGKELDEKDREKLAKQLAELEDTLRKTADAQKQAQQELKEQVEEARRQGNLAQADKLQQQLDKLQKKSSQAERMSQLAQQLKSAAESLNKGNSQQASDALGQLSEQLAGMQSESEELEMLDDALAEFADAKNSMGCKECEGEGCEACQGGGFNMNNRFSRSNNARGEGRGAGDREEQRNNTGTYDTQVKQNVRKGAMVVTGTADGPNRKGQVQEEIKSQFSSAEQQSAEALSGQRLPHDYRDHAKKYFDTLREGQ